MGKLKYTRSQRKESESHANNSAISDHVARDNHVINWGESKILERESDRKSRWIRESICIRRRGRTVMNRDEGIYNLSHLYDPLLNTGTGNKSNTASRPKRSDVTDVISRGYQSAEGSSRSKQQL